MAPTSLAEPAALVSLVSGIAGAVLGSILGALLGARAAWHSLAFQMMRRERAIAAALLEDLRRIESVFPNLDQGEGILYEDVPVVGVHGWLQPLVAELAARDAELVGMLMQLEAPLTLLVQSVNRGLGSRRAIFHEESNLKSWRDVLDDPNRQTSWNFALAHIPEREAKLAEARERHAVDLEAWRSARARCDDLFDGIRYRASVIAGEQVRTPWYVRLLPMRPDRRLTAIH